MKAGDLKEIAEFLQQSSEIFELAKALAPVAEQVVDTLFLDTPQLRRVAEATAEASNEIAIKSFKQFLAADFSREEALLLTIDKAAARTAIIDKVNIKRK